MEDFEKAMTTVRPSVSQEDLKVYHEWNKSYGSVSQKKSCLIFKFAMK